MEHGVWLAVGLVALLVPVAAIDWRRRIIPDALLTPAAVYALAVGAIADPAGLPEQTLAALAAGGLLLAAALARPGGMGIGDVKLAAVLGLFLGRAVAIALLVALLSATLLGAAIALRRGPRAARAATIPFGPFLALGGIAGLIAGPEAVPWFG